MPLHSHKAKRELIDEERVALGSLLELDEANEAYYNLIQDEKPKRKRKPKPESNVDVLKRAPYMLGWILFGLVGVVVLRWFLIAEPAAIAPPPNQQVVAREALVEAVPAPDLFHDRWMLLNQASSEIPTRTYVRVMSQDDNPEYYNVADIHGNLSIVPASSLSEGENAPSPELSPPLGPFSAALGKNAKLLKTIEWNGDLAPDTQVYAMGWRAQDGTWVYEVSPDRSRIYYLPWIHLVWADSSAP